MNFHFTIEQAISQLKKETGELFTILLKRGALTIEYYAPKNTDEQKPHKQDEIYVVASGTSTFFREGQRTPCKQGDLMFVPAGIEHRFENFSEDFGTWVIFY
jgi:mannose-6-phosphate isomerase-like protein (cupin superfamily)